MEKLNSLKNIGVRKCLPPGFRFQPTEEELVFQYLKCKVFSLPLPASIIPHLNLSHFDPWDFPPGNCDEEEDRYFFSLKEAKYRNGNRMNRTTMSGYWKATGSDKKISGSRNNDIIMGIRKTLVFCKGNSPNGSKTNWTMHEYRLVSVANYNTTQVLKEIGDWVLCRIFLKKRNVNAQCSSSSSSSCSATSCMQNKQDMLENVIADVADHDRPRFFGFMMVQNDLPYSSASSSSCSSSNGIIEPSSIVCDHEESSAYPGF